MRSAFGRCFTRASGTRTRSSSSGCTRHADRGGAVPLISTSPMSIHFWI
jgi:hypothetical protein